MQPILIIVLVTAASVPLGLALRRNLAKLNYRSADEADRPAPGPRWWVAWASVLAIGGLAAAAILGNWRVAYMPLLPIAVSGPWLAAVDLDVMRLPNRILAPTVGATSVLLIGSAATTGDWRILVVPAGASLVTGAVFASLHFITEGGIGFGDVKLAALLGLAVAPTGAATIWLAILTGSGLAIGWTKATRQTGPLAFGPWLLAGSWFATALSSVISGLS